MRVLFVAMGFERLAIGLLGSLLRREGHRVGLAFSPHLFDDRYWLSYPRFSKFIESEDYLLDQIRAFRPEVVCFSSLTVNYRWNLEIARKCHDLFGTINIFGGIHPSAVPDEVIKDPAVDYVCVGEGDEALPQLIHHIQTGRADRPLPNIYFRDAAGGVVKGQALPFFPDLDSLPIFEKDLWEDHLRLDRHYMTMSTRGCPYRCTYCFNNFFAELPGRSGAPAGSYLRQRGVDHFLHELRLAKQKYNIQFVHIKDDVFTLSLPWLREFAVRYRREIGVPFHCLSHPNYLDQDKITALRDAGCVSVQFGVESADTDYKREELRRYEDAPRVDRIMELLQNAGMDRKVDHILGFPGEELRAQDLAMDLYAQHGIERIGTNWLVYLPGTEIIQAGLREGRLSERDVSDINRGVTPYFIQSRAFVGDKLRELTVYEFIFRLLPLLPRPWRPGIKPGYFRWVPLAVLRFVGVIADFLAIYKLRERRHIFFYIDYYRVGLSRYVRHRVGKTARALFSNRAKLEEYPLNAGAHVSRRPARAALARAKNSD